METPIALMKVMGNGESAPWGSFQLLGALSQIKVPLMGVSMGTEPQGNRKENVQ